MKKISDEKLIFDNATFSNFARIEKLELIFHISKNIYTTKEVIQEVKKGIVRKPKLSGIIDCKTSYKIKVHTLKEIENILLMSSIIKEGLLGIGEISAMMSAKELGGIFITDDEKATEKAAKENIRVLRADDWGVMVSEKNKFKDTVVFLEILKKQKNISQEEFDKIREMLKNESFNF